MKKSDCISTFYNGRVNRIYTVKTLKSGLIEVKIFININNCFGLYRTQYFNKGDKAYFNSGLLRWNIDPIFGKMEQLSQRDQGLYLAWRRLKLYNNPRNDASLASYLAENTH